LRFLRRGLELKVADPGAFYAAMLTAFSGDAKDALYTPDMRRRTEAVDSDELVLRTLHDPLVPDRVDAMLHTDVENYLPGDLLVKMDLASMASSLEARSPFLDHQLMEFAARLPSSLKLRRSITGSEAKYVMKLAARELLPREVLERKKMGFGVPIADWLRGDLRELTFDALTDQVARQRGFFEPTEVRRLLEEHVAGTNHSTRLWGLLQFELWCRAYVDNRSSTAEAVGRSILAITA
jgi:asparagine synthase (glutamine-hydrolysing)